MQDSRSVLPERNLDLLRAIAVMCVFICHSALWIGRDSPMTEWLGQAGVLAFFVHTSLVLMSSLERDDAPRRLHWVSRFYVRRAFRIYPLAWVVIAVVVVFEISPGNVLVNYEPVTTVRLLSNLALMQNLTGSDNVLTPLWTLPLELQMYALLPLCYLIARSGSVARMIAMVAVGMIGARFFIWGNQSAHHVPGLWRLNVLLYIPCFLMGVVAYWAIRRFGPGGRQPLPSWSWPLIIVADIVLVSLAWGHGNNWFVRPLYCAVLGAAIPLLRDAPASLFSRVSHTIAVYSYGIYLTHVLALRVGFGVLAGSPLPVQFAAVFAVLFAACFAGYHLIEKPGIALGQRFVRGWPRGGALAATAPAP